MGSALHIVAHHHRMEDICHELRPRPAAIACGNCGSILRNDTTTATNNTTNPSRYKSRPTPGPRGGYVNSAGRQLSHTSGGGDGRIGAVGSPLSSDGNVGPDPLVGLLMAEINSLRGIIHKLSAAVAAQQQSHNHHYPQTNPSTNINNSTVVVKSMKRSNIAGSSHKKHTKHVQFAETVQEREDVPFYPRRNAMEYTSTPH